MCYFFSSFSVLVILWSWCFCMNFFWYVLLFNLLSFMFNVKNFKVPFFTFCSFFLVHLYLEIKMLVNFTSKVEFSNFPANITSNFEVSFFCFFFFFCCWRGQCRIMPVFFFEVGFGYSCCFWIFFPPLSNNVKRFSLFNQFSTTFIS